MAQSDHLLAATQAIHAAALDGDRWSDALQAITRATGASAASLETYDFRRCGHRLWRGFGNEPEMIAEYMAFHSPGNPYAPRRPSKARQRKFPTANVLDLAGLGREPFYADYITYTDPRYFAACLLEGDEGAETVFTLTRDPSQGHMEAGDVALFRQLMAHARLSLEVGHRLDGVQGRARALAGALDMIAGGAALLDDSGRVLHANRRLEQIGRAGDGLALSPDGLRLSCPQARDLYAVALGKTLAVRAADPAGPPATVRASRPSGARPYSLALRPLLAGEIDNAAGAALVVFVSDPCDGADGAAEAEALRSALGLTAAEARLAGALRGGSSPIEYARRTGVSVNTTYTHLRRLKDKVGVRRLPELIHALGEARSTR